MSPMIIVEILKNTVILDFVINFWNLGKKVTIE